VTCSSQFDLNPSPCLSLNTGGTITAGSPVSPFDGAPWHYIQFLVNLTAGIPTNIYVTTWSGGAGIFHFVDSLNNVLSTGSPFGAGTVFQVTAPSTGFYGLVFQAFDPAAFGNTTLAFFTDCATANVPCTLPAGLDGTRFRITGYTGALFNFGACAGAASGLPAWAGTWPDYAGPGSGVWDADSFNFPSNFSIQGRRLAQTEISYNGCNGAELAQWSIFLDIGNAADSEPWFGVSITGSTPAGVYTRFSGCSPGPATITVEQF